jgi:hypothetical protein
VDNKFKNFAANHFFSKQLVFGRLKKVDGIIYEFASDGVKKFWKVPCDKEHEK